MTEQMNVPKLRFGEFDSMLELSYFGKLVNDITYGPRFSAEDYCSDGNVRTIRGTDMGANGEIKYNQVPTAQLEGKTVNRHELKDGDLVMITTADCGVTSVYREQPIKHICSAYAVKINLNDNADSTYFKYFYQTSKAQYEVSRFIRKATVSNLPGSDINRIRHYPPSLQEQQKIASFLSKVDEKITLLSEKKDKLTEYKKGVMQQLFNGKWEEQDGQLTFIPPTLRFKADDGSEFPDWTKSTLGDIGKVKMCKRIMANQTSENGDIPFFKIGTFGREPDAFISQELYDEYRHKFSFPNVGDILMSASGTLGRTVVYDGSPAYFQDSNIVWIENDGSFTTNEFLFYVYQIVKYQSEGGTIQRLYNNIIMSAVFDNPSLKEQKKIVKFLSAIDQKIDLANLELEKAKEWKRGLLQQMFV